jgi:hypothetical protein
MLYKTITLELIQDRPKLYFELKSTNRLLPAVETYAAELRASHQAWKQMIASRRPGSNPAQLASEALELAVEELTNRLPSAPAVEEAETFSLDEAMNYLKRVTPPA